MKRSLLITFHQLSMQYYWNRMKRIAERDGLIHNALMKVDEVYYYSHFRYHHHVAQLVALGAYVTARSLLRNPTR
jgi:hypothetical protein